MTHAFHKLWTIAQWNDFGNRSEAWVTGNTGIDAILQLQDRLERGELTSSAPTTTG